MVNFLSRCTLYVTLPNEKEVIMKIKQEYNKNIINIGQNGTIYFVTDSDDSEKYIFKDEYLERNFLFTTEIIDEY